MPSAEGIATAAQALGAKSFTPDGLRNLLEGRFILGVGPGGLISDAEMMGTMDEDRNAIFVEAMDHMIALWTEAPPYRLKGQRWNLTTERSWTPALGMGGMLKPFQKPHPPIVVTAILPNSNGISAAAARSAALARNAPSPRYTPESKNSTGCPPNPHSRTIAARTRMPTSAPRSVLREPVSP